MTTNERHIQCHLSYREWDVLQDALIAHSAELENRLAATDGDRQARQAAQRDSTSLGRLMRKLNVQ